MFYIKTRRCCGYSTMVYHDDCPKLDKQISRMIKAAMNENCTSISTYQPRYVTLRHDHFPKTVGADPDRSEIEQGGYQLLAVVMTLAFAIGGGVFTGQPIK